MKHKQTKSTYKNLTPYLLHSVTLKYLNVFYLSFYNLVQVNNVLILITLCPPIFSRHNQHVTLHPTEMSSLIFLFTKSNYCCLLACWLILWLNIVHFLQVSTDAQVSTVSSWLRWPWQVLKKAFHTTLSHLLLLMCFLLPFLWHSLNIWWVML